jgi:uncharacterized damage-inducible protein DinB
VRVAEFHLLFRHAQWETNRVLAVAAALSDSRFRAPGVAGHAPLRSTLVHVLNTQRAWRHRCERQPHLAVLAEEKFPTVAALQTAFAAEWEATFAALSSWQDGDLETPVEWWMPDLQQRFSALPWQLLYHSLHHGIQHRSEVAETLTVHGESPGDLDFGSYLLAQGAIRPLP